MICGIGTDLVQVSRVAAVLARHGDKFLWRVLGPSEMKLAPQDSTQAAWVAKRWAVKEAAAKALGVGIGAHARFTDFQVVHTEKGAPKLEVSGSAALTAGANARWHVSITDDGGFAQAFVVWEGVQVG